MKYCELVNAEIAQKFEKDCQNELKRLNQKAKRKQWVHLFTQLSIGVLAGIPAFLLFSLLVKENILMLYFEGALIITAFTMIILTIFSLSLEIYKKDQWFWISESDKTAILETYAVQYNWANFFNCSEDELTDNRRFMASQLRNGNSQYLPQISEEALKPIGEVERDALLQQKQKWAQMAGDFLDSYQFHNTVPNKIRFLAENVKRLDDSNKADFLWENKDLVLFETNADFKRQWHDEEQRILSDWQTEVDLRYYSLAQYLRESETLPQTNYTEKLAFLYTHEPKVALKADNVHQTLSDSV